MSIAADVKTLIASVGLGGENRAADVCFVQELLNLNGLHNMPITGQIGDPMQDQTIAAIIAFQSGFVAKPDGRIDPNGHTFKRLYQYAVSFDPRGKTLLQRVDAFVKDTLSRFSMKIIIPDSMGGRTAEWAQRAHIAHMIKYNSYRFPDGLKPKHFKAIGGHNLLDFAYLQDPTTTWDGVRWDDFLRNASSQPCKKSPGGKTWADGFSPDEAKTRCRAFDILSEMGVATADNRSSEPHSAQVAPGYQGCREPCACGGNRSRHIEGAAIDLGPKPILKSILPMKFLPPGAASFNKYLARFGLKRPVSSESWHVEPIAPCP